MRPIALSRKNALFAGGDEGGEKWAVIASLIETCKLNAVDPQRYFAGLLIRLGPHSNTYLRASARRGQQCRHRREVRADLRPGRGELQGCVRRQRARHAVGDEARVSCDAAAGLWKHCQRSGRLLRSLDRVQLVHDRSDIRLVHRSLVGGDHLGDLHLPGGAGQVGLVQDHAGRVAGRAVVVSLLHTGTGRRLRRPVSLDEPATIVQPKSDQVWPGKRPAPAQSRGRSRGCEFPSPLFLSTCSGALPVIRERRASSTRHRRRRAQHSAQA